ncbi:hypothetical protein CBS470a_008963 [Colletotrichum nupharicola]|nr:hypothetical protein CBS470a_008963 [Colletotrichum nupharicola]
MQTREMRRQWRVLLSTTTKENSGGRDIARTPVVGTGQARLAGSRVLEIREWHAIKDEIGLDIRGGYTPEYVYLGEAPIVDEEMGGLMTSTYIRFGKDVSAIALEGLYGCTSIVIVSQRGAWVSHIWEDQLGNKESWALMREKLGPLRKGYHDKAPHDREYAARDYMMYGLEDMIMKPDLGPEGVLFGDVRENGDDPNQKTSQDISVRAFIVTPKERPKRWAGKELIPDEDLVFPGNLAYQPQNKVKACPVYQEERCEVSDCGDACPVILWKDVEKPTWMTKRGMPVEGDWPDPEDYPEGRRDRFLINEFQLITTWDPSPNNQDLEFFGGYDPVWVRHGQPEHVGVEMAGMTTSNHVRFDSQVAAITIGGLYGCTAVVVVSQRGAWVSHIWENQIYTQKEFTFLVNDMLPKGIAPGEPGAEWMKFGMNTMVENPDRAPEGVMFGDVKEKDDNTKDDAKSTQDIGTRAYIIAPRVRAERFRNGQLVPESEFLNDLNHNMGQIRYPSQVGKLKQIVRDSLGDIPVETLGYSPQSLPNRIVEKYEMLRMERVRAGKQETPEEASARRKECRGFQENVARTSVRGKLLIQYHPAKTCNDMASWRLWWENREIGNKYDSWVPESNQIFQSKNAPRQVCSIRKPTSGASTATKGASSRTQKPTGSLAATRSAGSNSTRPGMTGTGSPPRVTTTGSLNATITRRPGSTGSATKSGALTSTTKVINSKTTSLNNTTTFANSKTASSTNTTTFINSKTASLSNTTTFINSKTASHSKDASQSSSKPSTTSPRSTPATKTTHTSTTTSPSTSQPKTSTSRAPATTSTKPKEAEPSQGVEIYYELAIRVRQGAQTRTGRWVMIARGSTDSDPCTAPHMGEADPVDDLKSEPWPESISTISDIHGRKKCKYASKDGGPGKFSCDGVSSFDCVTHTGYDADEDSSTSLRCGELGPSQKSYDPRVTCWFPVK